MDLPELTDREALFQLLASAPDGILLVDETGTIALANDAAEKLFGFGSGELRGCSVEQLIPERLRQLHVAEREAYASAPRRRPMGVSLDLVGRRKDGGEIPLEISLSPMRWDGQALVVAILRDVSDRRAAEADRLALARAQAVEQVVAGLDAMVWEAADSQRTQLVYAGGRDEALLGYPRERWLEPDFWLSIVHPEDLRLVVAYSKAAQARQSIELEYRLVHASGRAVTVHDTVSIGRDGRVRGVTVDVTERRELEARLAHTSKMEAVGQLAGGIAHDFNNLLAIAAGHAHRLARRAMDPRDRHELAQIIASTERAAALTKKLLAFARRDDVTVEPVEPVALTEIVEGVAGMVASVLPADVALAIELAHDVPPVESDRVQLEQLVMNLLLNARDAMPYGGSLSVRVDAMVVTAEDAGSRARPPGPYATLTVSDSGHGIPPEIRERIFEPFFTTKDADHGTGLGLATVYAIVEQAGGYIEVDSEPGKGTTFQVILPAVREDPVGAPPHAEGRAAVLVVDDEPALQELASLILEDAGYVVLRARTSREALHLAKRYSSPIQLLLTDVVMPHPSGPELAQQLRRLRPDVRVLYMSGYHDSDLSGRGLSEDEVIRKPFDPDELVGRVERILGGVD